MRWLAAEYSQEGYLSDPTLRTAANTPNSRLKVTRVSPSAISDNAYRQRFYADAHIGEELAMTFLQRGQGLYFCFFRSEDKVKFAKQDASQLRRVGAFLSEVFSKHMEVLGIRSNTHKEQLIALAGPEDRQRKFQGMLNTLQSYPCELSQREAEICAMIALGYTSQGIGLNLGISINTVGTHRKRAYMKLGISSQAELFAYLLKLHSNVPALPA
jgi:DNA-binding CsgD family transcriptional regulator